MCVGVVCATDAAPPGCQPIRYLVHVWEMDPNDSNGLERYVMSQLAAKDLDWFPVNRAKALEKSQETQHQQQSEEMPGWALQARSGGRTHGVA